MGGIMDKLKGRITETRGDITGSRIDKAKGRLQHFSGDVKLKADEAKSSARDRFGETLDRNDDEPRDT